MFTFVRNSNANRRKVALFEESEPRDYAHGCMFIIACLRGSLYLNILSALVSKKNNNRHIH